MPGFYAGFSTLGIAAVEQIGGGGGGGGGDLGWGGGGVKGCELTLPSPSI